MTLFLKTQGKAQRHALRLPLLTTGADQPRRVCPNLDTPRKLNNPQIERIGVARLWLGLDQEPDVPRQIGGGAEQEQPLLSGVRKDHPRIGSVE